MRRVFNNYRSWSISLLLMGAACTAAEVPVRLPEPKEDSHTGALQTAVLAGGCFWGIEGIFEHVRGVQKVVSGYAGGDKQSANYKEVSSGRTAHAESVQIVFDPKQVSYGKILQIFFSVGHDPTQLNRQGPDFGPQYRSAIFYTNDEQRDIAKKYLEQLKQGNLFARPVVTRLDPLEDFYPAEGYHQDFMLHNPLNPYIVLNDAPKVKNLERMFPDIYHDWSEAAKGG